MIFPLLLSIELNSLRADLAPFFPHTTGRDQSIEQCENSIKPYSHSQREQWNNLLVYSLLVQFLSRFFFQHSVVVAAVFVIIVHTCMHIYIYLVRTQVKWKKKVWFFIYKHTPRHRANKITNNRRQIDLNEQEVRYFGRLQIGFFILLNQFLLVFD